MKLRTRAISILLAATMIVCMAPSIAKANGLTAQQKIVKINKYLKGSPLQGQGANIYKAAEKNNIDARLVPAISCIESGKGRHTFRNHNAWGWGHKSWSNWKVAIYGVSAGIHRGYGRRSPQKMSHTYCPTNSRWGSMVAREMNKIY